jgi:hypothetical protein
MYTLFIVAAMLLAFGLLSLLGLFYLAFKREAEPGSRDLLIWSSVSASTFILGDVGLAITNGFIQGHVFGTIALAWLTLMACAIWFVTVNVWRDRHAGFA